MLYKNLSFSLAEPLSSLFASCQSVGKIPDEWRSAIVTPLYKGGISSAVSNYRPVSLTRVACKIMERIIASEMISYLHAHDVISKQQHGFLSRRCTESNLLECLNDWTIALHNQLLLCMLILHKHLTVLVITNSVTNYYPVVLTTICIACWKIFHKEVSRPKCNF